MMPKMLSALSLSGILILSSVSSALAQEVDLSGVYRCDGTSPSGRPYRATVAIAKDESTYRLRWTTGEGTSLGIGILNGDVLAVSYFTGTQVGVVLYKVQKGPKLVGQWALLEADGQIYPETLTKMGTNAWDEQMPADPFDDAPPALLATRNLIKDDGHPH